MPEGAQEMMYSLEDNPEPEPVPDPIIENKNFSINLNVINLDFNLSNNQII